MSRKGNMLIQVVVMLFFLGIISISFLPILISSINNFKRIKLQNEMIYIGEMVVEKIKAKDESIISNFSNIKSDMSYEDEDFDTDKFKCNIYKIRSNSDLLEFLVRVENKHGKIQIVEFKASIPNT